MQGGQPAIAEADEEAAAEQEEQQQVQTVAEGEEAGDEGAEVVVDAPQEVLPAGMPAQESV